MKRILSLVFILMGIALIAIPYLNDHLIKRNVSKSVELVEEITYEEMVENESIEAVFDYSSVRDVSITTVLNNINEINNKPIIAEISIDDLGIDLPILKGVSDANLLLGAATMVPNQELGKGNYSLAGHYLRSKKTLFGPLLDIETGTIVKISNKRLVYEYEIYDTKIVEETAMYMLDDERAEERGKPIISLMTCYFTSKNGKRFFALGELVDVYPYDREMIKFDQQ
ncbi:MAG: class A sortase [Tissierella sp.]|nr:class A sortase [Tissierella sp.]